MRGEAKGFHGRWPDPGVARLGLRRDVLRPAQAQSGRKSQPKNNARSATGNCLVLDFDVVGDDGAAFVADRGDFGDGKAAAA